MGGLCIDDVVAEATLAEIGKTYGTTVHRVIHLLLEPLVGPLVDHKQALALALLGLLLVGLLPLLDFNMVLSKNIVHLLRNMLCGSIFLRK